MGCAPSGRVDGRISIPCPWPGSSPAARRSCPDRCRHRRAGRRDRRRGRGGTARGRRPVTAAEPGQGRRGIAQKVLLRRPQRGDALRHWPWPAAGSGQGPVSRSRPALSQRLRRTSQVGRHRQGLLQRPEAGHRAAPASHPPTWWQTVRPAPANGGGARTRAGTRRPSSRTCPPRSKQCRPCPNRPRRSTAAFPRRGSGGRPITSPHSPCTRDRLAHGLSVGRGWATLPARALRPVFQSRSVSTGAAPQTAHGARRPAWRQPPARAASAGTVTYALLNHAQRSVVLVPVAAQARPSGPLGPVGGSFRPSRPRACGGHADRGSDSACPTPGRRS